MESVGDCEPENEICSSINCIVIVGTPFVWSTPITSGKMPCARGGHTAILFGTNMFVFGGHYYSGDGTLIINN